MVWAISTAMGVLGWMELPEEEVPPRRIWHHEERLTAWFEAVDQKRKDRMSGTRFESVEDADMTENEMAAGLR
jgi:hypothetical protein